MSKPLTPMQSASMPHPSANRSPARSENEILRDNGFKIHARPNNLEPSWTKDGKLYLETAALAMCGVAGARGWEQFRDTEPCCLGK